MQIKVFRTPWRLYVPEFTISSALEHADKQTSKLDELIETMNQVYAVVPVGGKTAILRECKSEDGLIEPIFMDQTSFNLLTKNVPTNSKTTAANIWLASPHRRQYEKVVFAPEERVPPKHYNLWRGFAHSCAAHRVMLHLLCRLAISA